MRSSLDKNRAKRRAAWPMSVRRLQDGDGPPAMAGSTAQERIAAVAELTRQSWSLTRADPPGYSRHAAPVKVVALSDVAAVRAAR